MTDPPGPGDHPDLAADATLRQAAQVARAWGVPLSRFMGREPARRTVYERAPDGRVLAARTEVEPEWTQFDRDIAIALDDYERDLCPGCRHPLAETTAPEAEDRFVPGQPIRCHRCTALSQARSIHTTEYHPDAVFYGVRDRKAENTGDPDHAPDLDPAGG